MSNETSVDTRLRSTPVSEQPPRPAPERCSACDCPINPMTGECRGCSD